MHIRNCEYLRILQGHYGVFYVSGFCQEKRALSKDAIDQVMMSLIEANFYKFLALPLTGRLEPFCGHRFSNQNPMDSADLRLHCTALSSFVTAGVLRHVHASFATV